MAQDRNKVGTSTNSIMSSAPFVGGLNTELSGVVDSVDFTKDECNMLIRADGTRSRRPGVDYEELFRFNNEMIDTSVQDLAFNCIEWYDVNSPDESVEYKQIPYIVVQIGSDIIFYKNYGQPYSRYEQDFKIDLKEESGGTPVYALDSDPTDPDYRDPAKYRCKFTVAYGCLFITSEAIKPIRLRGAEKEPEMPVSYPKCVVSCSAFQGKHQRMGSCPGPVFTDSLLGVGFGPTTSNLAYYEILIDGFVVLHKDIPLVGDYTPFPNSYTIAAEFNSLPSAARRGISATPFESSPNHFTNPAVYPEWTPLDYITFTASSYEVAGMEVQIVVYGCAYKSGYWRARNNVYSGVLAGGNYLYSNSSVLSLMIRDTYIGAEDYIDLQEYPEKLSYAHLYNLLNQGWTPGLIGDFYLGYTNGAGNHCFPANNLAQQYLKDSTTEAFKPDKLINTTFGNTPAARGHVKINYFYQDRNNVADLTDAMIAVASKVNQSVADILDDKFPGYVEDPSIITDPAKQVPVVKPRRDYIVDTIAYAGRIFYLTGSTLLYSQVLAEDVKRADKCYTDADPTSEELSDVVETDGGLIELPDIGEGIKLAQVGQYLLVFGTRGNVAISGTANNIFTATAYSAGSLNAVPTQAPDSFVNTEYGLFYWGTTGITFIAPGEGLQVQDLSTQRILTWYGSLSNTQHKYCKGVYSAAKKKVYWFYPSDDSKPRRLDRILVFDIQFQAFVPSKVATGYTDSDGEYIEADLPEIVSGLSLKVPYKSVREYPVIASSQNYEDLDNGYISLQDLNILEKGIMFRFRGDAFEDMSVGDTKVFFKYAGIDFCTVEKMSDTNLRVHFYQPSGTAYQDTTTSSILWVGLFGNPVTNKYYYGAADYTAEDYTAVEVPESFLSYLSVENSYILHPIPLKGPVVLYKDSLGDFDTSFCRFAIDLNDPSHMTGKSDAPDNGEGFVEVGEEIEEQNEYILECYRDAQNSLDYSTMYVNIQGLDDPNRSHGAIFRCALSAFSDMPNNTSMDLVRFRNGSTKEIESTLTMSRDGSGYFTFQYTGGSLYGPLTVDEILWIGVYNDFTLTPTKTYIGFCEESLLGDSGYTAQNLPDASISEFAMAALDNYTENKIILEFPTKMLGDISTSYASVVVDKSVPEYLSRTGEFYDVQSLYYLEHGTDNIFKIENDVLVKVGEIRKEYSDSLFDYQRADLHTYSVWTSGDDTYYTYDYDESLGETMPVFVEEDGELVLFGFCKDLATSSSISFASLEDPDITLTASYDSNTTAFPWIEVLVRYEGHDTTYTKNVNNLLKILADDPIASETFTYESSILLCLDVANGKVTFGDFRNNLIKDWTAGDATGDGYMFDSYLISHPMNATSYNTFSGRRRADTVHTKNMPYLLTYFRRTETGVLTDGSYIYPSSCQGSILWDWRTSGAQGKWSSPTDLYRPYKKTIFDNGYIFNKTNIRGLGKAFQVKLESVGSDQFIVESLVYDLKSDGRI